MTSTDKMLKKSAEPVLIRNGIPVRADSGSAGSREKTIAYRILREHDNTGIKDGKMRISFDAMISHDITYVNIIQTARASGMKEFPLPYALTNCHNSLCAVGGTINEDDHAFGLSAAKKYGGIYVPPNQAVIHQFAREKLCGCGKMILGSDSHTRYGCYGTVAVGEGGGELVKQLLKNTWDIEDPEVVLIWLEGNVPHGIGPHDVAIKLVGETFPEGFVKNRILEFAGPGVYGLSMDFRTGIDVMTTETGCLSSVWVTDEKVREYYENIGRPKDYVELSLADGAYYDRFIRIDLSEMESMIALPFHPSKAYTIHELQSDPEGILKRIEEECNASLAEKAGMDLCRNIGPDGRIRCDQGVIVGCAGGMYENIAEAADILRDASIGNGYFDLSVYPSSAPINLALIKDGITADLLSCGAVMKPCFCGPCFGAGDTPAHNTLSIRHATRNFANREGSKPAEGQISAVALMDARSIAATALNGGTLTAATDIDYTVTPHQYHYDDGIYEKRCFFGYGKADPNVELKLGPNITDWPEMPALGEDLMVQLCAVIHDDVTTTDELIPSGESSSYRSNPIRLSDLALSRRVPEYVSRSKAVRQIESLNRQKLLPAEPADLLASCGADLSKVRFGSCIFSHRPGDGSAREQAASCQKVLGGFANICYEYATKRYRSNCINWGIVPFTISKGTPFEYESGDWVYIKNVRDNILNGVEEFDGIVFSNGSQHKIRLYCGGLTEEEKQIIACGCLINYYASLQ